MEFCQSGKLGTLIIFFTCALFCMKIKKIIRDLGTATFLIVAKIFFFRIRLISVLILKCFIKHMCFIVLYFHGHVFFLLEIVKKCFIVLYFWKNVLYFCK